MKTIKTLISSFILMLGLSNLSFAALVDMAEYQDWDGVESSISTEDINALQADGMSALFWAVYHEQEDIVRLLLDAGADTNVANRYGLTPLIQSSLNGNGQIISLLLDAGANPNAVSLQGDTALMNAAKAGTLHGVQSLLDAGADVDARDTHAYQTALMWATASNSVAVVSLLIESGADVNARSAEIVFSGIQQGGVQGDFPNGGLSSLHHAARENSIESAQLLLAAGANPSVLDPQGISPLRVAATNKNLDLAKLLIEGGADLSDGSLVDIMEIPYKRFAFEFAASNYEDTTTVQELTMLMLEMGASIDATSEKGIPLFSTGFVGEAGTSGQTALYNAALGDRIEDLELLLEYGANPNALSSKGATPLAAVLNVYAGFRPADPTRDKRIEPTFEEKRPIVDTLLANGADVNITAEDGSSILHHAASLGNDEVVELLLELGVDLALKDDSNRTALDVASGVPKFGAEEEEMNNGGQMASETPIYETTIAILTEAMNTQGVAIEEYVEPASEESEGEEA
ncbi:MAG: ankyrin repeat domain-containing protein [Gammaproteobacteria bacterium]|jgi:uncharacterized protein|nr:ankyrin repeat domain-containing protein [Gammaproteobacteria bacterium]